MRKKRKKRIAIIGVGGRTGMMLANELAKEQEVLGVDKQKEIELLQSGKFDINGVENFLDKVSLVKEDEFDLGFEPDIIFLTIKNPIYSAIKYYFKGFKQDKKPILVLSQNGISAFLEAKRALNELGSQTNSVKVVRMVIFNPVEREIKEDRFYIKYFLPIRIAVSSPSKDKDFKDFVRILKDIKFRIWKFGLNNVRDLEFSKLFLNLIGTASASRDMSVKEGFKNKEVFTEEMSALKEYIGIVKAYGAKFLNFTSYPVGLFSFIISFFPIKFLVFFQSTITSLVLSKRSDKSKDLDEIDYYTGAVVDLGKKLGLDTPVNNKIFLRAKRMIKN